MGPRTGAKNRHWGPDEGSEGHSSPPVTKVLHKGLHAAFSTELCGGAGPAAQGPEPRARRRGACVPKARSEASQRSPHKKERRVEANGKTIQNGDEALERNYVNLGTRYHYLHFTDTAWLAKPEPEPSSAERTALNAYPLVTPTARVPGSGLGMDRGKEGHENGQEAGGQEGKDGNRQ